MEAETGGSPHALERPSNGAGSVPSVFPLPQQSDYGSFASAGGVFIGWRKDQFLIMGWSRFGSKKLHGFPLTEEGWIAAWQTMSSQYPQLAAKVSDRLAEEGHVAGVRPLSTYAELQDCTLLGGYGWSDPDFVPGNSCTLGLGEEGLSVYPSDGREVIRSPYEDALALEFSGPGRVKSGTRIIGGGFGLGAAVGIIGAGVLNSLTSRTNIHTVIRYEATNLEAFFFYSQDTPDELRMRLSKVLGQIRPKAQGSGTPAAAPVTRLDQLKQLGELRDSGVLSQAEFETEKQNLLTSD